MANRYFNKQTTNARQALAVGGITKVLKKLLQGIKTTDGKRQKKLAFGIKAANRDKAKVKK